MKQLLPFLGPILGLIFSLFGGGWIGKEVQLQGISGSTEPVMLGGFTVTGLLSIVWLCVVAWKKAGGKLDGVATPAELSAVEGVLFAKYPQLKAIAEQTASLQADVINKTVGPTAKRVLDSIKATSLIDQLSAWFTDPTPDPNEPVLNNKLLDILAAAVKDDPKGSEAAAVLRARLHDVLFAKPTDPKPEITVV